MKIVFMGTPDFALPALKALADKYDVVCVYSQPPRPAGRGHKLTPSPVQAFAESLGIEVRTPISLKSEEEQIKFKALNADVAVVAAYGLILPLPILEAFPMGCINIHGSLLPRWRGAAPIQRAIMAGDEETGVTIMQMDEGMDTGDMLLKEATPIAKKTSEELFEELALLGAEALLKVLDDMPKSVPQGEEGVTYAPKVKKEEGLINWAKSAKEIEQQIRAIPSWFMYDNERIKIKKAEVAEKNADTLKGNFGLLLKDGLITCGEGLLNPLVLQREGKAPLPKDDFLRGFNWQIGKNVSL